MSIQNKKKDQTIKISKDNFWGFNWLVRISLFNLIILMAFIPFLFFVWLFKVGQLSERKLSLKPDYLFRILLLVFSLGITLSFLISIMGIIHSFDKKIYVLESNQKEILEIDSTQNTHRIISAPSEALIRDFVALDNRLILLSDGLWQIDLNSLEKEQLKTQGETDQEATLLAVYENYFYLFNPSKRNIYRFTETDDGLSEAIGWLVDKQGLDFTSIQDMAVDGDLWLSDNTGKILRYSRGYQSDFQIQGLAEAPSDTLEIEAKPESETLLAFDKAAKRLLIFRKNGEFLSQIRSNELAAVTDVSLVSEQLAYALSGSILYRIQW